jgi:glycosyltransferase involved in cell wall biosynthesis
VCLLPVRNGAEHLPSYLDSVSSACDAVVALDDGSIDDTRTLLEASPLVRVLLTNPKREGYFGWNDGENRNRLLEAAEQLTPDWVLFLDVDERIDASDAAALRDFVDHDALPGCAYGFQLYRMLEDGAYDPDYEWVYRLMAFRPGQRVPDRRLDFIPVPSALSQRARVRTSLRIQHLGEETPAGRERRVAKYREADPAGEFSSYYERLRRLEPPPPMGFPKWLPRAHDLPVLGDPLAERTPSALTGDPPAPLLAGTPRVENRTRRYPYPRVVCLLAARNCQDELAEWFESVARVADSVVALDDGSTDGTGDALRSHPLVEAFLSNERRPSYATWDDAANRNRLLEAAATLEPDWIISLDADERIPPDDGDALRRFVLEQGIPGFAYGFPRYRMVDDLDHYDQLEYVAWRLFAWVPGQRFPDERLHLTPVPTDIPVTRRLPTTVRIQHLAGLTEARRQARWAKYEQADPDRIWEPNYEYVRAPVGVRRVWWPRPAGLPVVLEPADPEVRREWELARLNLDGPVLTVAVLAEVDTREQDVELTVRSVFEGPTPHPIEVLVVAPPELVPDEYPSDGGDGAPGLRVVPPDRSGDPASLRNVALRASRGDYVLFVPAGQVLDPEALSEVVDAHERGFAIVGAEVHNRTHSAVGWASYFLDHAASLPGGRVGALELAPTAGSVAREAMLRTGGFPAGVAGDGSGVMGEWLGALDYRSWRAAMRLDTRSEDRGRMALIRDQVRRGRALAVLVRPAATGLEERRFSSGPRPAMAWAFRYGPRRLASIRRHVTHSDPAISAEFRRAAPLVALGVLAAWAGLLTALLPDLLPTGRLTDRP